MRRVASREVPVDQLYDGPDRHAEEPDEQLIDDERLGAVLAAFEALPEKDQRLLRLVCDVPPKTYQEIAAILGRSAGHLGPTRQRALARLRALLAEQGAL